MRGSRVRTPEESAFGVAGPRYPFNIPSFQNLLLLLLGSLLLLLLGNLLLLLLGRLLSLLLGSLLLVLLGNLLLLLLGNLLLLLLGPPGGASERANDRTSYLIQDASH